jgi:hypothetical protein
MNGVLEIRRHLIIGRIHGSVWLAAATANAEKAPLNIYLPAVASAYRA